MHEAGTPSEALALAITQRARPIGSLAPDLPAPVAEFVDRALAYEQYERYADARAMQAALRAAYVAMNKLGMAKRGGVPSTPEVAPAPAPPLEPSQPAGTLAIDVAMPAEPNVAVLAPTLTTARPVAAALETPPLQPVKKKPAAALMLVAGGMMLVALVLVVVVVAVTVKRATQATAVTNQAGPVVATATTEPPAAPPDASAVAVAPAVDVDQLPAEKSNGDSMPPAANIATKPKVPAWSLPPPSTASKTAVEPPSTAAKQPKRSDLFKKRR